MARAEAVDSVAESGVGGISTFSHPITCRMARPLAGAWPGLLTANMVVTGGGMHALPRHVHALQTGYTAHTRDFPAATMPPPTLCSKTLAVGDSEEQSDSASNRPPELHPTWASNPSRDPEKEKETLQELEIRRVANQLRIIGDQFNVSVQLQRHLHRGQHWRHFCRGILIFLTQTLATFYRLT